MRLKIVFLCAQICLIKTALSQCFGPKPAVIAENLGLVGAACAGPAGGPLLLQNSFPMPTPGLSIVADDLIIEGLVSVSGRLPFLGTVSVEGILPTAGQGSVLYGCGNGEIGILGEGLGSFGPTLAPDFPGAALFGPGIPGPIGPAFAPPISPAFAPQFAPALAPPIAPAFAAQIAPAFAPQIMPAPFAEPCNMIAAPQINPGMAAAANTAALAAAANSAGQAAALTSIGLGAAANAAGLTAMAGF